MYFHIVYCATMLHFCQCCFAFSVLQWEDTGLWSSCTALPPQRARIHGTFNESKWNSWGEITQQMYSIQHFSIRKYAVNSTRLKICKWNTLAKVVLTPELHEAACKMTLRGLKTPKGKFMIWFQFRQSRSSRKTCVIWYISQGFN